MGKWNNATISITLFYYIVLWSLPITRISTIFAPCLSRYKLLLRKSIQVLVWLPALIVFLDGPGFGAVCSRTRRRAHSLRSKLQPGSPVINGQPVPATSTRLLVQPVVQFSRRLCVVYSIFFFPRKAAAYAGRDPRPNRYKKRTMRKPADLVRKIRPPLWTRSEMSIIIDALRRWSQVWLRLLELGH